MSLLVRIRKKLNNGQTLDVSFTCEDGCAILGMPESGKTMTLRCIAGLEQPDEGQIVINGRVIYDSLHHVNCKPAERGIGFLPAQNALCQRLTVEENVRLALSQRGRDKILRQYRNDQYRNNRGHRQRQEKSARNQRERSFLYPAGKKSRYRRKLHGNAARTSLSVVAASWLHEYSLDGLGNLYPSDLSPTQYIRAAVCRMMAAEPSLVLLDDPFACLDSYEKARVLTQLRDQLKNKRIPVIFASRDRDEIYAMSRQVCALDHGKSQELEYRQDFFAHPQTVSAALLSGVCNVSKVYRLNETHAVSESWKMVFARHADTVTQTGEEREGKEGEEAGERKNASNDDALTAPAAKEQTPALWKQSASRKKRHEELREDLERSLRFELIPVEEEQEDDADVEEGKSAASGASSAEQLPGTTKWQSLPASCSAVGIRADGFETGRPEKGRYLTFRLHQKRIEEGLSDWKVYFVPYLVDDPTQKPEGASEILWQVPRKMVCRDALENTRVLFLPEERLLFLSEEE